MKNLFIFVFSVFCLNCAMSTQQVVDIIHQTAKLIQIMTSSKECYDSKPGYSQSSSQSDSGVRDGGK